MFLYIQTITRTLCYLISDKNPKLPGKFITGKRRSHIKDLIWMCGGYILLMYRTCFSKKQTKPQSQIVHWYYIETKVRYLFIVLHV